MPDFDLSGGEEAARKAKARKRIEAALDVARHPNTAKAERDAAIAGAERIIAANGLDRASFRFPGDPAPPPPPKARFRDDLYTRPGSPFYSGDWTREDFDDVMNRFRENMRTGGGYGYADAAESVRRAQEEAHREREEHEAYQRRRAEHERAVREERRADAAIQWLWALSPSVRVYGDAPGAKGDRVWRIPERDAREYSDAGVIEVAEALGFGRQSGDSPYWFDGSGRLNCRHGRILHGDSCAQCERDRPTAYRWEPARDDRAREYRPRSAEEAITDQNRRAISHLRGLGWRVELNADDRFDVFNAGGQFVTDKDTWPDVRRRARELGATL